MAKKLAGVDDVLNNLQSAELEESDLGEQLENNKDKLKEINDKLQKIMDRADEIQNKIDEICAPLK